MGQARRFLPLQRGFDFFYGHGNNGIDYYTHERYGIPSLFRGNERTEADKGTYATDIFKRESLRFIRENKSKPWLLYLAFNAPHGASSFASQPGEKKTTEGVQAPEKYVAPYRAKGIDDRLARYFGAVTCVEKDTLVMFLSDNGGSGNGGNAPLKGGKGSMWEGGLRVPFIAWWPGRLPAGKVTDEFLTSLEIFPTLLAASGADPAPGVKLDGFDMLPILSGTQKSPRTEMFWQRRGDKAARVGNWKWSDSAKARGLFDLTTDLGETKDLSNENPEMLAKVKARWEAWRKEMDATEPRGPFRDY
jgi:arylsulfatase A-like enzyme